MDEDRELERENLDGADEQSKALSEELQPDAIVEENAEQNPGYGQDPGYEEIRGYGQDPGYEEIQGYGQTQGYGQNSGYEQNPFSQPGYGTGPVPRPEYHRNPHAEQVGQMGDQSYGRSEKHSSMALASLIMGIIGIVTSCCCYGGIIFGCLGILFALLSKTDDALEGYAKAGLITSSIALVLAFLAFFILLGLGIFDMMMGGGY